MNLSDEYKQVPLFFNIIYWRIPKMIDFDLIILFTKNGMLKSHYI